MKAAPALQNPTVLVISLEPDPPRQLMDALTRGSFTTWHVPDRADLEHLLHLYRWSLILLKVSAHGPANRQRCLEIRDAFAGLVVVLGPLCP
jgi:hypothetical protein